MKEVIISGKNITKSFGENTVLHGINVELYAGDFTVVMGSSGSGKSTLLYALSGMDLVSGGQIICCGQDITAVTLSITSRRTLARSHWKNSRPWISKNFTTRKRRGAG